MKKYIIVLLLATGCSHLNSTVTETNSDGTTKTTKMKAFAFFDSKSALTKFRASQSDKTQAIGVGTLNQEASGSNVVTIVQAVVEAAVKAAVKP